MSYESLSDLEQDSEITALDEALSDPDFQKAGIEDIRGKIYNQPGRIYAKLDETWKGDGWVPTVEYFGVEETEVSDDFYGRVNNRFEITTRKVTNENAWTATNGRCS